MKRSRLLQAKSLTLLVAVAAAFVAVSCGRLGDRFGSRTYRIPWPDDSGALSLQNVEIQTLSDPEHFSGTSARILVQPGDGGDTLNGPRPAGHYARTSSGVLIPADYVTMQAVTAYAHEERLHDVDTSVGAVDVLSWPVSVGIEVRLMSYGQQSTNNAVYDAKLNSLLLVPYDEGDLPIALNPGVLAHEHFHFIFQRIVMSVIHDTSTQTSCSGGVAAAPSPAAPSNAVWGRGNTFLSDSEQRLEKTAREMDPKVYNAYVLRGMNEGFADFYGWVYSHDDSFLAKSLPDQDDGRRLDVDGGRLPSESLVRRLLVDNFHPDSLLPEVTRAHNAYSLGSIYARYLRRLAKQLETNGLSASEARLTVARALIAALPSFSKKVSSTYETGFLSPNAILPGLIAGLPPLTHEMCASLADLHAPEATYAAPPSCVVFDAKPQPTVAPMAPLAPVPAAPLASAPVQVKPTLSASTLPVAKEKK